MEWPKLKNIILILLLAVNVFLLVLVTDRETKSRRYEAEARDGAVAILAKNDITLDPGLLPKACTLQALTIPRDETAEAAQAAALLGESTVQGSDGVYAGTAGQLRLYPDGAFSFSASPGAYPLGQESPSTLALSLLARLGVEGELSSLSPAGDTVTVSLHYQGAPVFAPREITVVFQDGALLSMEGYRISGAPVPEEGGAPLGVATVLMSFLEHIKESTTGIAVFREITAFTQGYHLVAAQGVQPRLVPAWHISTDTGEYYLNALTGTLL